MTIVGLTIVGMSIVGMTIVGLTIVGLTIICHSGESRNLFFFRGLNVIIKVLWEY